MTTADAVTGELVGQRAYADDECQNPSQASISSDGRVFLVCEGSHYEPGSVAEIDPQTLSVLRTAPVGLFPDRLAMLPAATERLP